MWRVWCNHQHDMNLHASTYPATIRLQDESQHPEQGISWTPFFIASYVLAISGSSNNLLYQPPSGYRQPGRDKRSPALLTYGLAHPSQISWRHVGQSPMLVDNIARLDERFIPRVRRPGTLWCFCTIDWVRSSAVASGVQNKGLCR